MESADRKKLAKKLAFVADPIIETIKELERVDFELSETNSKIDQIQEDSTKIVEAINHLDQTKADKEDVAQQIENIARMPGRPGNPGRDGKDYILTPKDKEEIASKVKVPIVEKVIERTEVIKEQPVIKTEIVKEITQDLEGTTIIERINSEKDTLIKREKIEGLDKKLIETSNETLARATSILDQRTQFLLNKQTTSGSSSPAPTQTGSMTFIIGDGETVITAGTTGYLPQIPYSGTITGWYLTETSSTPVAGSIVIDIWKDTTGNYPPTVLDTIAGTEKPTLSTATNNKDETLSTWTTTITAGDCIGFKVDSVTSCKKVTLVIKFNKS